MNSRVVIASFASLVVVCGLDYGMMLGCVIFVASLTVGMENDETSVTLGEPTQL